MRIEKQIEKIARKIFAQNLTEIRFVDGKFLSECVTLFARVKCSNCGLYSRGLLCPPLLAQTYSQFTTIDSSRKFFSEKIKTAAIIVFKNDGTIPWKRNVAELAHIEMKKRFGRQLKGVENGSAKAINKYMRTLETKTRKEFDVETMSLICGHCDICPGSHRCPNRENPPCRKMGMTSLEATGLDVYKILDRLGVSYEYPALTLLTQTTCLLVPK